MEDYCRHIDRHGPNRRTCWTSRDLDADILNVRRDCPDSRRDTIQTSAMKSSILHRIPLKLLQILPYPPSPESTKASPRRISPELRLSTSSHPMHRSKSARHAVTTPIAEYLLRNDRHHRIDRRCSDRIISHNEIISDTASFRSIYASNVVDTPSVMTQNLSTTNLDATSAKIHTLDSTDMKTSSFHTIPTRPVL
jgi:hypothetical protein